MIIEVYETISDKCITVITKGDKKDSDCEIFLREIEGLDYNDCMRKHYEIMGWEPYINFD